MGKAAPKRRQQLPANFVQNPASLFPGGAAAFSMPAASAPPPSGPPPAGQSAPLQQPTGRSGIPLQRAMAAGGFYHRTTIGTVHPPCPCSRVGG
jgi:hypothetical protein